MTRWAVSHRSARALLVWAGLLATGAAVTLLAPAPRSGHADVSERERGARIYATTCSVCHGADGRGGTPGPEEVTAGPPLRGLEVAYVDQQLRTGRMPIVEPAVGVTGPERLADADRAAVVAWMTDRMALEGEIPEPPDGDRTRGHELYQIHCAACHGSLGDGGVGAEGTLIRGLLGHDRVAHVEAIRVGPYDMPAFDEDQLSDQDAADIAEFVVADLDGAPRTPLGMREMHRYTMWGMAALLALALLGTVVLLGRPVRFPEAPGAGHGEADDGARDGGGGA